MQDIRTVVELRLLVGYLGEQAPGWWASSFLDNTAEHFLKPVFGRSAHTAQYHGVLEAARRVHDEHIGIGRTLHLFHLPEGYEQKAAAFVRDQQRAAELLVNMDSPLAAQKRLKALSVDKHAEEGPVLVGDFSLSLDTLLAEIAGCYLDAFRRDIQTYPYLREVL